MHITYRDNQGVLRPVDETLNDLATQVAFQTTINTHVSTALTSLQQENVTLRKDFTNLQKDFSDTKNLILRLQEQQNTNHMTIWEAIKKYFKLGKPSNITTSEVDLSK